MLGVTTQFPDVHVARGWEEVECQGPLPGPWRSSHLLSKNVVVCLLPVTFLFNIHHQKPDISASQVSLSGWPLSSEDSRNPQAYGRPSNKTYSSSTFINFSGGFFINHPLPPNSFITTICAIFLPQTCFINLVQRPHILHLTRFHTKYFICVGGLNKF